MEAQFSVAERKEGRGRKEERRAKHTEKPADRIGCVWSRRSLLFIRLI